MNTPQPAPDTRPEISRRDLSYHLAQAGIAAREAAAAAGGDATQVRALVAAAMAELGALVPASAGLLLRGHALRQDDLLVSLCLGLYNKVFGADPRQRLAGRDDVARVEALAEMVLIFTQAETAWDLLDRAAESGISEEDRRGWARDFRRAAVEFAGNLTTGELATFNTHLEAISRRRPATIVEDEAPGKPLLPGQPAS